MRNHTVTVVPNGKAVLTALENNSYDLVLMDMQMPEMDGFEATTILRSQEKLTGKHQPVIAMTALAMDGDHERRPRSIWERCAFRIHQHRRSNLRILG